MGDGTAVIISRESSYANQARSYYIYIDETNVGKIKDNRVGKVFNIVPGQHEIYMKIDWLRSKKISFAIQEGEIVRFKCGSRIKGLRAIFGFFYIFAKDKWVYLEKC